MITKNDISSLNLSPTKKDFVQIWNELIEVASKITERWDPTSTNESDPGIVLLKVLTGIADKLNYNIDKNILEAYMPTAAQMESMRKLCEMVGYDIKYYQSAATTARISYTGNTADTADNDERLPATGLAISKFTTLTNADKDITFVTTNVAPMLLTNTTPWVEVPCIEGQISQCESINENNLITLAQLDDNNRYYLPEVQIAENGIFVYNAVATASGYTDGLLWDQVSNLNTRAAEQRVFKFGYDSFEGRPYLAFPDDVGSLIGDGLFIYFVRTSGLSGNISPRTLEVLELPTGKDWESYSAELFEVVNVDATTNGANIESISTAYNNFKKTVGTFDTLVTCRDYMNKIYSLMDASNSPYVSNILVTDIRNDINSAITLCSCNEFGIMYKEMPLTETHYGESSVVPVPVSDPERPNTYQVVVNREHYEVPLMDHFDLRLYPFKTFTQVSSSTTDKELINSYNKSFTYTEQMNREIDASLADFKTLAHNLTTPADGDIVAINNYLRLDALIATSMKVSEIEAKAILDNVKAALVSEFNLRNLDFGEEIPFDSILSVIENADSRIKAVALQEPTVLTTYSVKEQVGDVASSTEYGIATTEAQKISGVNYGDNRTAKGEKAQDIYNKLVLRNILAGRASLLKYDETFIPNNSEKPYTVTKNITASLNNESANPAATQIKNAISETLKDPKVLGDFILFDSDDNAIKTGFHSSNSVLTLRAFEVPVTEKLVEKPNDDPAIGTINAAIDEILKDSTAKGNYILYNSNGDRITNGLYGAEAALTLKLRLDEITTKVKAATTELAIQIQAAIDSLESIGAEHIVLEHITGFNNGTVMVSSKDGNNVQIFERLYEVYERVYQVYETYEPNCIEDLTQTHNVSREASDTAATKSTARSNVNNSNIIDDVTRVEAICELKSNTNTFNNVTLGKNEVIKFRAPNLITTKTFPAYVYYRFERDGINASHSPASADGSYSTDGSYAAVLSLRSFINDYGADDFFTGLWNSTDVKNALETRIVKKSTGNTIDQADELPAIFNAAIAVSAKIDEQIEIFTDVNNFSLRMTNYFEIPANASKAVECSYYKLNNGTLATWNKYIRECFKKKNGKELPDGTTLWRLSSTSGYTKGRLTTEAGQRLYAQGGEYLSPNFDLGATTYICIDHGSDPVFSTIASGDDVELRAGDRLYIHYTPSSTNEDGETTSAEPISIVYRGGEKEPVIIKPSGFTLIPSDDLNKQGTSWKKTDVDFGGEKKNLMALAPNEQIEMRSISKVVLNKPARFYRNFEAKELDGNLNATESYELKDGEYIFYTDQSTQEAAYYGSGSVITLDKGAFIPKASDSVEISQILEQGLHVVPWSSYVLLNDDRKVTITEYQYITLTAGDKLNTLTIEDGNSIGRGEWKACDPALPINYTTAGAENPTKLPKIALSSGVNTTWEVCSFLELSTSPGYEQQLRVTKPGDANSPDKDSTVTVTDKLKVYTTTATGEESTFEITPQTTVVPAYVIPGTSEEAAKEAEQSAPLSIKLDTIAQVASGSFKKTDSNPEDDIDDTKMRLKLFSTEAPTLVELADYDEELTPISNKHTVSAEPTSENLNNYWTKLDIKKNLLSTRAGGTTGTGTEPGTGTGEEDGKEKVFPNALNLNFMIPENADLFGIFSIYLEVSEGWLDAESDQQMVSQGRRVFIDIPNEFGPAEDAISIFNLADGWWTEGRDSSNRNRLYLRAGLNCIRVNKSCSILIKAEEEADGSILYDNLRLVKGREINGINLELLDPDAAFNIEAAKAEATKVEVAKKEENQDTTYLKQQLEDFEKKKKELADKILSTIAGIDKNHDFYYNVPVENSLAIEFDNNDNVTSFSNPYTLYDINNVNNSFVVSKLDVANLKYGLKIAKSSKY
jgi:hypothetical protein